MERELLNNAIHYYIHLPRLRFHWVQVPGERAGGIREIELQQR